MFFRTRRELEDRIFLSKAAQRRAAKHRDVSWFELIVSLSAFAAFAAGCFYLVGWSEG